LINLKLTVVLSVPKVYAGNLVYALLINEGQSLYMMKISNLGFY